MRICDQVLINKRSRETAEKTRLEAMVMDNPNTIAYDKTVRTLFNVQSSADDMVAGSTKHIQNLTLNF